MKLLDIKIQIKTSLEKDFSILTNLEQDTKCNHFIKKVIINNV